MSTSKYTSADRLYKILESLLESRIAGNFSSTALARALNVSNTKDEKLILKRLSDAVMLAHRLKELCGKVGGRMGEGFILSLDTIIGAMLCIGYNQNQNGLDTFAAHLWDRAAMADLANLAAYISDHNLEKELKEEDLASIKDGIAELIEIIENATIDADFKKELVANLKNLVIAIQEYEIFGSAQINSLIQKSVGQTVLSSQRLERTEENINLVNHVLSKMRDFNTIISFSTTVHHAVPLIASATTLINCI